MDHYVAFVAGREPPASRSRREDACWRETDVRRPCGRCGYLPLPGWVKTDWDWYIYRDEVARLAYVSFALAGALLASLVVLGLTQVAVLVVFQ